MTRNRQLDRWKRAALAACAAAALAVNVYAATSEAPDAGVIALTAGAQKPLARGRTITRVALGDPSVADVNVLKGGGVLLVGKSAGTTNLMLWQRGRDEPLSYTVEVAANVSAALADAAAPQVRVLGKTAVLTGTTPTMATHQRAVAAARAAVGKDGALVDASAVATKSVVQVDVKVVEFSKTVLKEAGFNLFSQNHAGFAFGTFAPSALTSVTGGATSPLAVTATSPIGSAFNLLLNSTSRGLFANLSLLESNNLARVLAQPTLVALSGQSASFLAGGEIPVPVPQSLGTTTIVYKPYGIGLSLTPTVLGPERIALKVAPEASQLDFAHAITIDGVSVPALTTRRAETAVELGDGESFVIGGLVDRETASNVNKVPLLGDLPIIGAFFKTLQYSQQGRELVIVVTPHLVAPIAKNAALPSTPGQQSEQRDGPVWRSFVGGALSSDAAPGFSR
ncbi:exported fimbriae assembly protein [Caballeronia novacaledonica]|uniref:Exported fimbriae assembly protein n=1 Tax=Caballeronia novacaledonica TaxID=1544861 RepID=A0A2U3I5M7_9BURK|nr:type II and III secretion system protein family protein [Caballeronia novacaledonica]SPB15466.1 exported fimbriae assembly protein [Caballeronia novacaledonica]